jgi:acetylornithine deacetylase/succinyl-diaminopimelate desuccinylase-like protein
MRSSITCLFAAFLSAVSFSSESIAQTKLSPADRTLARDVFEELIEIVTTDSAGATPLAAQAMADRLITAGFPREDVRVLGPNPQTGNLVARLRGRDARLRPLLLMAHIDVVPARREDWSVDPWTFLEREGWFYGRGTIDNKAGAAMLVANLIRMKREGWQPKRDVIVVLTGDEETSQESIEWLLAEHRDLVDAELALNTDAGSIVVKDGRPTLFTVQASEKIYADYALEVTDKGGHSSLPRPDNPIYTLATALLRIGDYKFPVNVTDVARTFFERSARVETGQLAADMRAIAGTRPDSAAVARLSALPFYNARLRTTCVATRLEAGHANNALPQLARAVINCRILPDESPVDVEATLRRLASEAVKVTVLEAPITSPPSPLTPTLLGRLERLVAAEWPGLPVAPVMETGATDGLFVRRAGIPTYGLSALTENPDDVRIHGKDERVEVQSFYEATQFWYRMVKMFAEEATASRLED